MGRTFPAEWTQWFRGSGEGMSAHGDKGHTKLDVSAGRVTEGDILGWRGALGTVGWCF